MNLEELIDQFELVTDTEEGLEQLRKLVLDEAVKGNITKRNSDDERAEKLLGYIEREKQRLYDEGEIRKPKDLPEIAEGEIPYDLPDEWKWARFGNIAYDFMTGVQRSKKDQDPSYTYPYVKMNNITATGQLDLSDLVYVQATSDEVEKYELRKGDFLFNTRNSEELVGKTCVFRVGEESPYLFNNNILRVDFGNSLSPDYINYWFNSNICNVLLDRITSATTNIAAIYQKDLLKLFVPIPPKEEQQRIVQKIETLFSQVDELEQKVQQDRQVDERLQVAVLDDLQRAETPEASRQSWQRLTDHFEQIYHKPEHIDQLKQAILNETIRGRLVPQDPTDEPAEKLLERIKDEKQRLYEEGEIRKPKDLDPVSEDEIPYELPEGWSWARIGDSLLKITDGTHKSPSNGPEGDYKYVTAKNIKEDGIQLDNITYVDKADHEKIYSRCDPEYGDLLYIKDGATTGIATINDLEEPFSMLSSVALLKPNDDIFNKYLLYALRSPFFYNQMRDEMHGAAITRVTLTKLNKAILPIPPRELQYKIASEVERLMNWCDDLKEKLSRSQQTDQRLLEALVKQASEEEKVKPEEQKEATIYQMPKRRKYKSEVKKLSGISTTDTQAAFMALMLVRHSNYSGEKWHLGRTLMEKANHILESHLKIDLGRAPKRMARGAADFAHIKNKVEYRAQKQGWFSVDEGKDKVNYYQGTRIHEPIQKLDRKLGEKKNEVDRIINLFLSLSTKQAEIYQTTYAAWHDLIAYGKDPSDDEIVLWASTKKYWAEEKEKISKHKFYDAIKWLRENDLVPDGKGKLTVK